MQADKIWEAALGELQLQVSKANYDTWLRDSRGIAYLKGVFTVAVPTAFIAEWLKSRLLSTVCRILCSITGQNIEVAFQVLASASSVSASKPLPVADGGVSLKMRKPSGKSSSLNSRYTFNTFVSGECNRLAYTAAVEISGNPGELFNPLFIYGGTGIGKTHLLHAIGQELAAREICAIYMSAEQFTNEFVMSIRNNKNEEFRGKFNEACVLLLDDIQFFSGKMQTQESFLHIINDFLEDNRQVVISCDRPPKDIESLKVHLRSRLEGGLVADMYAPDHKTRLAILESKSRLLKASFDSSILNFLATGFHSNVRELEGALIRLASYARLDSSPMDLSTARKLLNDMISVSKQTSGYFPANQIINAVADYYSLSPDDITGKKRDRETSRARHVVMYLLRQQNHTNLSQIGKILGNRDHSTVIHGCEKITAAISTDSRLSKSIEDIRSLLKSRGSN
ncbi:MAG: chromosomal replication initiator protein DnaA [Chloroflexi bacterium]|nr:chromosomal replication initiator protein DnaA [Chloroflexota bacterium]